jgi:chromosome segregation ATPase
VKLTRKY